MRVAALAGCSPYQRLTPERLAAVLLSDRGLQKSRPDGARFLIVLTKVSQAAMGFADELVEIIGDRSEVIVLG